MTTAIAPPGLAGTYKLARNLMDQYGLKDWTLRFGHGRKESGSCNYKHPTLTLSAPLFAGWTDEHRRDTILHEIAHALTRGHHHDRVWRATFLSMGGSGKVRWTESSDRPALPPKFIGTCPRGHTIKKDRRDKTSCAYCNPRRFDARYLLTWTRNPDA